MIRFNLKTLLAVAAIVAILIVALPVAWMQWRPYVCIEDGSLLVFTSGHERYYRPSRYSDPVGLAIVVRVPLLIVGFVVMAIFAAFFGGFTYARRSPSK